MSEAVDMAFRERLRRVNNMIQASGLFDNVAYIIVACVAPEGKPALASNINGDDLRVTMLKAGRDIIKGPATIFLPGRA